MEEGFKNKLILALAILTAIFLVSSVSSCLSSRSQKKDRDKEMALRIDLEEKISKVSVEKTKLEEKMKELDRLIAEEKKAHEATKKVLAEEQLVNKSLRNELEKVGRLKQTLETDLKSTLGTTPKKTTGEASGTKMN